jgi:hypothetical protein
MRLSSRKSAVYRPTVASSTVPTATIANSCTPIVDGLP